MMTSETGAPFAATLSLVRSVRGIRWQDMPEEAREVSRHCLLDFLGVALAGAAEPLTRILVDALVGPENGREASLVGRSERATRQTAALVNGAAAHALDFDDTHPVMTGHPSVPVLPALLALAESEPTGGRRLLEALVAGIELECRLGALLGGPHYVAGFHSTGTIGTFGAAAACAHLLDCDEEQWLHALGLAGTQAAGLKSGFGTMAKPLHAGRAAAAGLLCAVLARRGFTANPAILEAPQGFAATHAGGELSPQALDSSAGRYWIRDTLFKVHAACYLTHAAIEATSDLRLRHGLGDETIRSVEVHVAPMVLDVCNIETPKTGLEGKFSLRATTALALLGADTGRLDTYTDANMAEPRLVALRDRVRVVSAPALGPLEARVVVETDEGRFEAAGDKGVPASDLGAQRGKLRAKFLALASPVLGTGRAERLAAAALGADAAPSIGDLIALARPD